MENKNLTLCHYCTLETLLSIISNNTIWLSDLLSSNDKNEDILLCELFYDFYLKKNNMNLHNTFFENPRKQTKIYGMCFSEEQDAIYHWYTYSAFDGVCICFNKDKLDMYFSNFKCLGESLCLKKVEYIDNCNCEKIIKKLFDEKIEENGIINVYKKLIEHSCYYKSTEWEIEKEYRVVIRNFIENGFNRELPSIDSNKKRCKLCYNFRNKIPVFHYELEFDVSLIKKIIIGPACKLTINELKSYIKLAYQSFIDKTNCKNKNLTIIDNIDIEYSKSSFYNKNESDDSMKEE